MSITHSKSFQMCFVLQLQQLVRFKATQSIV